MSAAPVELTGRAALVTGAGRGIGRAIATLLAEHGATVAVHYRADTAAAEKTVAALAGKGHVAIAADLAWCGRSGSPTKVHRIQSVVLRACGYKQFEPNDQGVVSLVRELIEERTLG